MALREFPGEHKTEIPMETIIDIVIGLIAGAAIGWLIAKVRLSSSKQQLEQELAAFRATAETQASTYETTSREKNEQIERLSGQVDHYISTLSAANTKLEALTGLKEELDTVKNEWAASKEKIATLSADLRTANDLLQAERDKAAQLSSERNTLREELNTTNQTLATAKAENKALIDKLGQQKEEMDEMGKKFAMEFENIANKILDSKTEKFTELNKTNLNNILDPLGKNLNEFKAKVEEVYIKEAQQRFSLGEKVKELAELNHTISEDARNLTKALKGESKTQGNWGEMILENILERSGLVKGREYFLEHQLTDEDGKPLVSASEGKKMRPDAVIKYPDKRSVIIDSKVSLNAFTRLIAATDPDEHKKELAAHVQAIKSHIVALSTKGYDDYDHALDFVMLFVPSEPAYIAALQSDADLWNFAYDKRILLLSPTNLITSLKLIVDLWKREYQNKNALDIADRGAKLYEKFAGFVANLTTLGVNLDKAKSKYDEAYRQLRTGPDNLVLQADKLKQLGIKTRKHLPEGILTAAMSEDLIPENERRPTDANDE